MSLHQPVPNHPNRQRIPPQVPELRAKPIPHHSINHENSIHFTRSSKNLASRQVPPFIRTDNSAGLQPPIFGIQLRLQISSRRSLRSNHPSPADQFHHFHAYPVYLRKIRPHPLQHDLPVDIHHVCMPNPPPVYHISHLHPRLQLVRLRLHREDTYLAAFQILQNFRRQLRQRTRHQLF